MRKARVYYLNFVNEAETHDVAYIIHGGNCSAAIAFLLQNGVCHVNGVAWLSNFAFQ